jgi:DNA-binding NarL/FixJ family response regulator
VTGRGDRSADAPLRVLVAASDAIRAGVRLALEGHGFVVCAEEARGGAAVEAALRERPDVCLIDVELQGGGVTAAAEIAARRPEAAVVMLAASPDSADVFEALSAGARGFLPKDIQAERLHVALRAVVEGEVALPRSLVGLVVDELRRSRGAPSRPGRRTPEQLTGREWEVLECMREGLTTSQIGQRLFIADVTVRRHAGRIMRKLRVSSREEAVQVAGGPPERSRKLNGD